MTARTQRVFAWVFGILFVLSFVVMAATAVQGQWVAVFPAIGGIIALYECVDSIRQGWGER